MAMLEATTTGSTSELLPKVMLYPRQKSGGLPGASSPPAHSRTSGSQAATREAVTIDRESVSRLFHMPITDAAQKLNICVTSLKKVCRRLGLDKWPYVKLSKKRPHGNTPAQTVECNIARVPSSPHSFTCDGSFSGLSEAATPHHSPFEITKNPFSVGPVHNQLPNNQEARSSGPADSSVTSEDFDRVSLTILPGAPTLWSDLFKQDTNQAEAQANQCRASCFRPSSQPEFDADLRTSTLFQPQHEPSEEGLDPDFILNFVTDSSPIGSFM